MKKILMFVGVMSFLFLSSHVWACSEHENPESQPVKSGQKKK